MTRTELPTLRQWTVIVLSAVAILGFAAIGANTAFAQPAPPNSYYGVAEADGTLAPEGTTIVAVANGAKQGSITVGSNGEYGSSDGEKLSVDSDIDSEVTFHVDTVDGPQADQTDSDPTAEVEELDLTFPEGAFSDSPSTATETETATETATDTQTATATGTATVTATATAPATGTATATQTGTQTEADEGTDAGTDTSQTAADTSDDTSNEMTATERASGITVTNASLNRTQVPSGGVVSVNATLRNTGESTASDSFSLVVGGNRTVTENYTLSAGETRNIQFRYRANETGEFPVAVGQTSAGTLTVGESGGLIPWGILRAVFFYLVVPIGVIYGILKALAIYYGY